MKRSEFLKICGLLGIGLPFNSSFLSCGKREDIKFSGKIIIVGGGAGGMAAGYLLNQYGIDFEILEASPDFGGRMKIDRNFADFPIPLGAEWIETNPSDLKKIVNNQAIEFSFSTFPDEPDFRFFNYSWFNFFEDYIFSAVSSKISFNQIVQSIDYTGNSIVVETQNRSFNCDKVIVCVPLQVLKSNDIEFTPGLPGSKTDAINSVEIWDGFKAFFEFSEKFYNQEYSFNISPNTSGQKIYYDAAYGQTSNNNILGLFSVGEPAAFLRTLSQNELKDFVLNELDSIYSGQATSSYINHISQDWQNEPFIKSGYLSDYADWRKVREIGKPVGNKVYFAGGEFTDGEDWVSVHIAADSAQKTVKEILF